MKMIKVVVADDERVIVRGLRKLIPWDELGMELIGEAYDGNQLRVLIDTLRPDVVISDISMPGYSGIDIIKEINESQSGVKVILISAFEHFSYARDAVKYGAVDYLVKPIDKKQLEQVMQKVTQMILEQSEGVRHKEIAVRFEQEKRNETIGELLGRLTDGDRSAAKRLSELAVIKVTGHVSIFLLETDSKGDKSDRWQEQGRRLVDFAITNVLTEIAQKNGSAVYFRKGAQHAVFFQHDEPEHQAYFAEEIYATVKQCLKLNVSIGVGHPAGCIEDAAISAKQASEALKASYFEGSNRVFVYRESKPAEEQRLTNQFKELQAKLVKSIKASMTEESNLIMQELLQLVRKLSLCKVNSAVSAVYSTFVILQQELSQLSTSLTVSEEMNIHLLERFAAHSTFEELQEDAWNQLELMRAYMDEMTGNKEDMQMSNVKKYLDEHYAENITLESLSEMLFMNPYYFSSFFKKHIGENFKSYLTNIRMSHAHRMLLQTDLMVYEIAERVGYNDARHFSNMFKKTYGKLPLEYKQSMKGC